MLISKSFKNIFLFSYIFLWIISISLFIGPFLISINLIDFQQGNSFKLIFIHVPTAWSSLLSYTFLSLFSLLFLIKKERKYYYLAQSFALLGTLITSITLFTGAIWGKLTWGQYWVWDSRITSVFILLLLFILFLILEDNEKIASFISIFGFLNIPIIKFSVNWWNTLHQPATFKISNPTLDLVIFTPIILIFFSLIFYTIIFIFISYQKNYIYKNL